MLLIFVILNRYLNGIQLWQVSIQLVPAISSDMARILQNSPGQAAKSWLSNSPSTMKELLGDTTRDSRTWVRSALPESERDLMQEGEYEYGTRVGIDDSYVFSRSLTSRTAFSCHPRLYW